MLVSLPQDFYYLGHWEPASLSSACKVEGREISLNMKQLKKGTNPSLTLISVHPLGELPGYNDAKPLRTCIVISILKGSNEEANGDIICSKKRRPSHDYCPITHSPVMFQGNCKCIRWHQPKKKQRSNINETKATTNSWMDFNSLEILSAFMQINTFVYHCTIYYLADLTLY